MSVAITNTGEPEAIASPVAASVLARLVRGHRRDPESSSRSRVPVGGVDGGLFVADADEPDARVGKRLPERQIVDAGQAEDDSTFSAVSAWTR